MYLTLFLYQTICCVIQKNRLIETDLLNTTAFDPMLKETVNMPPQYLFLSVSRAFFLFSLFSYVFNIISVSNHMLCYSKEPSHEDGSFEYHSI